ncbi:MAG TPA: RluA family pseudouridine synthase [Phycisphaerales bacterium]|nr:RluA family pseudouridine synthase [Phycisphaerales bacterium]
MSDRTTSPAPPELPEDRLARASDDAVRVVASGDSWVVIDKPAGMLSVPGRGPEKADCATARVRAMFPAATGPLNVHRLDMETSGLMVFGLDPRAHAALSLQFMHRQTAKSYVAVLAGEVATDEGRVELPLCADWPNRPRQVVCRERGKPAVTLWRVLERRGRLTRVEMRPETGRTHQLRVHAATARELGGIGAAILGDALYGDPAGAPRLMLHASHLAFQAPDSRGRLEFWSEPLF